MDKKQLWRLTKENICTFKVYLLVFCFGLAATCKNSENHLGQASTLPDSSCGDWLPYKNEECIKLVDRAITLQNKEDAEIVCRAAFNGPYRPKLVTVKTKEKQEFLQKLLFKDLHTVENVWLGLYLGSDGNFTWNDGTKLLFKHFADDVVESRSDTKQNCVQMESGNGVYKTGRWTASSCKKRNAVVCERIQPLSLAALQNVVLNIKLEMERNKQEHEQKLIKVKTEADQKVNAASQKIAEANQKISEANQKIAEASQQIATLRNNPVPINFIYTQLADQDPPTKIWPETKWSDVTEQYAGLFFRASGGNAAPLLEIQEANSPRLVQVNSQHDGDKWWPESGTVPPNGDWGQGFSVGTTIHNRDITRITLSNDEVRPRNRAVVIWKRTS